MTAADVVFWYWWVLAALLLIIELLAPGFFFLWMAASAFVTGCLLLLMPAVSLNAQIVVFSVLSVIAIAVWKFYVGRHPIESDHPLLNKRGAQYIDRVFNLYEAIENGQGKIKVDDTIWKVEGEDCGLETKVKVIGVKGTVFSVKKWPSADREKH
ncbi:NfeD family protein [Methylosarcina fibrata]|uniref:NfeD family protein n=1 Tax=Methylosarcina fibrata TaxID=105972 RepID=UPI00037ABCE4|nr:NfeD family protein [Methylosarcina fibrata]